MKFPAKKKRRRKGRHRNGWRRAFPFLLPSLAGLGVFILLPFAETVRRSFTNAMGNRLVGFSNYKRVLENEAFRLAVRNTVRFLGLCLPLLLLISLGLALLVQVQNRRRKLYQTTFLLPMAIPVSAVVLLWKLLFSDAGLVNGLLTSAGLPAVSFLGSSAAFYVLIFTYLWKNAGYDMILWLAGLDAVSKDLKEAAAVDGASVLQTFFWITLPELAPTAGLAFLLSLVNSFKVFREAYLVAGSYPHESMYMLQHLFNNWFVDLDMGRLTAAAVLMLLIFLVVLAAGKRYWGLREVRS